MRCIEPCVCESKSRAARSFTRSGYCAYSRPQRCPAYALAHMIKLAPQMDRDEIIVMNMRGRGDKDVFTVGRILGFEL